MLLVEDSLVELTVLKRMLSTTPELVVVGTARNGQEGLDLVSKLAPDVICTDLQMPVMDGLRFTKEVMARFPRPILVVSAYVRDSSSKTVFELLDAGAVDVFPKPRKGLDEPERLKELVSKIKILSGVRVFSQPRNDSPAPQQVSLPPTTISDHARDTQMIGFGSSTGGPQVLRDIFCSLPKNFPVPILCVQHISEGYLAGLISWLNSASHLEIQEMTPGEKPQAGRVYFPREHHHMIVDEWGNLNLNLDPPWKGHRPSANITLRSLAESHGSGAMGIILTGMGADGVEGLQAIRSAGGTTIAQDEQSSTIFGMPGEAISTGAAEMALSPDGISRRLLSLLPLKNENQVGRRSVI